MKNIIRHFSALSKQSADQASEIAALKVVVSEVQELKKTVATMQEKERSGVRTVALEQ